MGRKRAPGLEWLEPNNTKQRLWALEYLRGKGFQSLFNYRDKILPNEPHTHEEMLRVGMEIEQGVGARELFRDMKEAWRQERNRNKKKDTGHLVCAFTLNGSTKINLQRMAKELDTSATALLEKLIAKAYQAHTRSQQKHSAVEDRADTLMELREKLAKKPAQTKELEPRKHPLPNGPMGTPQEPLNDPASDAHDEKRPQPSPTSFTAGSEAFPISEESSQPSHPPKQQTQITTTDLTERNDQKVLPREKTTSTIQPRLLTHATAMDPQAQKRPKTAYELLMKKAQPPTPDDATTNADIP